jgi:hypothetical protein
MSKSRDKQHVEVIGLDDETNEATRRDQEAELIALEKIKDFLADELAKRHNLDADEDGPLWSGEYPDAKYKNQD